MKKVILNALAFTPLTKEQNHNLQISRHPDAKIYHVYPLDPESHEEQESDPEEPQAYLSKFLYPDGETRITIAVIQNTMVGRITTHVTSWSIKDNHFIPGTISTENTFPFIDDIDKVENENLTWMILGLIEDYSQLETIIVTEEQLQKGNKEKQNQHADYPDGDPGLMP